MRIALFLLLPFNLFSMDPPNTNEAWFAEAEVGNTDALARSLYAGQNINATTETSYSWPNGATALHLTARWGHTETVTWLIDHGIKEHGLNLNTANEYGWTPLHIAALWGYTEIVACLVDHGADPTLKNNGGKTAYDIAGTGHGVSEEKKGETKKLLQEL